MMRLSAIFGHSTLYVEAMGLRMSINVFVVIKPVIVPMLFWHSRSVC